MRVAFLGNHAWSVPTLLGLAAAPDVEIALVVTNPPRPAGRGNRPTPTPVADAAEAHGLPLLEVDRVGDPRALAALRSAAPDVLVVVAYGELLTPEALALAPRGAVNVHFSLLPRWRGAAPVRWALLTGDDVTGVTIMRMDEGLDTGPILLQAREPIADSENAGSLGDRLAERGAGLLLEALRGLEAGTSAERPQVGEPTLAPRVPAGERDIDWTRPAAELVRHVRAFAPEPGARAWFRASPLKVLAAAVLNAEEPLMPGQLIAGPGGTPLVGTGSGALELRRVAPSGRAHMDGTDWLHGLRIRPGERFSGPTATHTRPPAAQAPDTSTK